MIDDGRSRGALSAFQCEQKDYGASVRAHLERERVAVMTAPPCPRLFT